MRGEMPLVHGTAGLRAAAVAPVGSEEPGRHRNKSGKGKSYKAQIASNSGTGGKLLNKLFASRLSALTGAPVTSRPCMLDVPF